MDREFNRMTGAFFSDTMGIDEEKGIG